MTADGQDRLKQDPTKVSSGWAGLSTQLIIGIKLLDHLAGIDAEDVSGLYSGDGYDLVWLAGLEAHLGRFTREESSAEQFNLFGDGLLLTQGLSTSSRVSSS